MKLLTIVEGLNTGTLVWEQVGPWFKQLIENGKLANIEVTQADLDQDSVDLGMDLDTLQEEVDKAKAEGR